MLGEIPHLLQQTELHRLEVYVKTKNALWKTPQRIFYVLLLYNGRKFKNKYACRQAHQNKYPMKENNYYLNDLVSIYVDKLEALTKEIQDSPEKERDYIRGQIMAYYDVLTIMESQAELFDLEIAKFKNLDLMKYLLLK